jgi:glycogen(starch) synthase
MRVLHITTEFPPVIYGGLGTAVGGLVSASALAGLDVAVLLVGANGETSYHAPLLADPTFAREGAQPTVIKGVALFHCGYGEAVERGLAVMRGWQPDLIHLHVFWLWLLAQTLREQTRVPNVYTVHSLDRAEYELGQGPPECLTQWETQQAAIEASDRVIALTQSERQLIAAYCPTAEARVRVVGNGINDTADARKMAARSRQNDEVIVLYTGRFVERKGVRELIAAIPHVLEQAPHTRFVLAGGHRHCGGEVMAQAWLPPTLEPYRPSIDFTGWLSPEQLAAWYLRADILVVPSWYEPFGMVVLEGMLYGLCVAAASVGGPAEILRHSHTGWLFAPRSVERLAEGIVHLVGNAELRQRLGQAAHNEVRQTWLYPNLVQRMQGVYEELS